MKVEQVEKLKQEGKTYDLFYGGIRYANITMEKGHRMKKVVALEIINQLRAEIGLKPRTNLEKVEYKEADYTEAE